MSQVGQQDNYENQALPGPKKDCWAASFKRAKYHFSYLVMLKSIRVN